MTHHIYFASDFPFTHTILHPQTNPVRVDQLIASIPKAAWITATIKEGSKGPIACDFAFLRITEARHNLPGSELWLILRRNLDDPAEVKFYLSNAPANTLVIEFVRISGMRWPIETMFEETNGEVGFDHYEMRSWIGWQLWRIIS